MRYLLSLLLVAMLAVPCFAAGGKSQPGAFGFQGPKSGANAETVAQAKTLADDSRVLLTGNIVSQVAGDKDKYVFRDQTGDIIVDIDRKVFRQLSGPVKPEDTVRISGKVDKELGEEMEIDVKRIEIVK